MPKVKTAFFCKSCGNESPKWIGKCTSCGEWNTYVEEIVESKTRSEYAIRSEKEPVLIEDVPLTYQYRLDTHNTEFNRVLGGGLVPGSVTLIGGEPGIGKSTLMLQIALNLSDKRFLYISGEESEQQIRMRAERIGIKNDKCFILTETLISNILTQCNKLKPDIVLVDSIQTLFNDNTDSIPGSIVQIRETAFELIQYAKTTNTPVFLIGHINKDGALAGPKVLEHMVDTVLQFEGERNYGYRILRAVKNRFGSSAELGIYEMSGYGLREVSNPSDIMIANHVDQLSGTAIAATLEGQRPMLIETQALVSTAAYGTPQRSSTGFEVRRLNMLLAVLEKRCGFKLGVKDVFLNIVGGFKIVDPSVDLAIIAAILSSNLDIPVKPKICFSGEIGLSGEIRGVSRVEQRIMEAQKIGFKTVILSGHNNKVVDVPPGIEIVRISKVEELARFLFS